MRQGNQAGKPADPTKWANDQSDRSGGSPSAETLRGRGMPKNPVWKPPQNSQLDERSGIFFMYKYSCKCIIFIFYINANFCNTFVTGIAPSTLQTPGPQAVLLFCNNYVIFWPALQSLCNSFHFPVTPMKIFMG